MAHQAPLFKGFSRQEYWSGLPCPSPGDLPDPGMEPRSPTLQADSLTSEPPGKPTYLLPQGKSLQLSMATLGFGLPQWLSGKESPAMQETLETWVWSLGQEDPLEKEMATHYRILAWKIRWTRSLAGYSSYSCKESNTTKATEHSHTHSRL